MNHLRRCADYIYCPFSQVMSTSPMLKSQCTKSHSIGHRGHYQGQIVSMLRMMSIICSWRGLNSKIQQLSATSITTTTTPQQLSKIVDSCNVSRVLTQTHSGSGSWVADEGGAADQSQPHRKTTRYSEQRTYNRASERCSCRSVQLDDGGEGTQDRSKSSSHIHLESSSECGPVSRFHYFNHCVVLSFDEMAVVPNG